MKTALRVPVKQAMLTFERETLHRTYQCLHSPIGLLFKFDQIESVTPVRVYYVAFAKHNLFCVIGSPGAHAQ